MQGQPDGTFVLRRGSKLGTFALTVVVGSAIKNYQILSDEDGDTMNLACVDAKLKGGKKLFSSIANLLSDAEVRSVWNIK
jgi:hypothetical protein